MILLQENVNVDTSQVPGKPVMKPQIPCLKYWPWPLVTLVTVSPPRSCEGHAENVSNPCKEHFSIGQLNQYFFCWEDKLIYFRSLLDIYHVDHLSGYYLRFQIYCQTFFTACQYRRGKWGHCNSSTGLIQRQDRLKPNSAKFCAQYRTLTKKCKRTRKSKFIFHLLYIR